MTRARRVFEKPNVVFVGKFKRSLQERLELLRQMGRHERKLKPTLQTEYIVDGALGRDPTKPVEWRYHGGPPIPHISEDDFFRAKSSPLRSHHSSPSPSKHAYKARSPGSPSSIKSIQSSPHVSHKSPPGSPYAKSIQSSPKSPYRSPVHVVPVLVRHVTPPGRSPKKASLPEDTKTVVFMGRFVWSKHHRKYVADKAGVRVTARVSRNTDAVIVGDLTEPYELSETSNYKTAVLHNIPFFREDEIRSFGWHAITGRD